MFVWQVLHGRRPLAAAFESPWRVITPTPHTHTLTHLPSRSSTTIWHKSANVVVLVTLTWTSWYHECSKRQVSGLQSHPNPGGSPRPVGANVVILGFSWAEIKYSTWSTKVASSHCTCVYNDDRWRINIPRTIVTVCVKCICLYLKKSWNAILKLTKRQFNVSVIISLCLKCFMS